MRIAFKVWLALVLAGCAGLLGGKGGLGLDGWNYVANGLRGGAVQKPGDKDAIKLGGMDFRFDPLYGGFEAIVSL